MNNFKNHMEYLSEKDLWAEYRYLADGSLARLESGSGIRVYRGSEQILLDAPHELGSSLAPPGGSFASEGNRIWALQKEPSVLLQWDLPRPQPSTLRNLETFASDLQTRAPAALGGPSWISWIAQLPDASFQSVVLIGQDVRRFWTFAGIPYGFAWNRQRNLCLALVVPREHLPWQGAELFLGSYELRRDYPRLLSETLIRPPAPASGPCLEAQFAPGGEMILGLWRSGEWYQLWALHLETQIWTQLSFTAAERALPRRRSDTQTFFMPSSKEVMSLSQERGFFKLDRLGLKNPEDKPSQELASLMVYTSLRQLRASPQAGAFSLIGSSVNEPPALIEVQRREDSWIFKRDRSQSSPIPGPKLALEALSWPSLDGRTVHGFLYRDPRRRGPLPLILPIHGGPTEQVSATWPIKAQAFVQKGYAVLYVNYRGSWGYGHSYHKALEGRWGEGDLQDIVSSLKPLAAAGWIDPKRVGLWGGDIGGSAVLRLLQRYPQLFRAAVAVYPICDFQDYLTRCGLLAKAEIGWAFGSHEKSVLSERSPLYARHQIKTPLALFHGSRDRLVPVSHIESLASSLESREVPYWLKIYPDEDHGWRSLSTIEDYYCRVESFLARFLKRET